MRSFWVQTLAATGLIVTIVLWITYGNVPLSNTTYFSEVRKVLDEVVSKALDPKPLFAVTSSSAREQYQAEQDALIANRPENNPGIPEQMSPRWITAPRPTEYDFPIQAFNEGVSGYATVECSITRGGHPSDCKSIDEQPAGYGFGQSAARIVSRGQLTRLPEGTDETKFIVRVPFNLE